ncbi:MAG: type II toxin-antitoxin system HicB family antitoxin [Lachnospiraceae bacterium]|nr:type II toxin-antitoxin system HicB family antitoxin [Lachnospiraceae bacterium]
MRYPALFIPAIEGGYTVVFPDFPEIVTEGDDFSEALKMSEEILGEMISEYTRQGRKLPERTSFHNATLLAEQKMQGKGVDTRGELIIQLVSGGE